MNKLPKISIITPSFNMGNTIRETILSIVNQNYPNLEYIIMDGGSTDNSISIIHEFEEHITYWTSEKDNGQSDAIKNGFSKATGDLIYWLNADDVLFPGALHRVAKRFLIYPNASIYTGGVAIGHLGDGGIRKCGYPPNPKIWFKKNGVYFIGQMATFFNRKVYQQTEGINASLFQIMDRDILYKLVNTKKRICLVPGMIGFIRFHEGAKSSPKFPEHRNIRKKEISNFYKRNNINPKIFNILKTIHQLLRLFTFNYFRSWQLTINYKNKMMSDVWNDYFISNKNL